MKTSTIILTGTVIGTVYMLSRQSFGVRNAVADLKTYVTMPTGLKVSDLVVKIPVQVQIYNYHSVTLPIQTLKVTAEVEQGANNWVEVAVNQPNLNNWQIKPNAVTKINIEMQASLLGAMADIFKIVTDGVKNRIKINVIPTVMGVRVDPISSIIAV